MAKRWYYTFKTQSGHTCDVVIDDKVHSGITPIELNKDVAGSPGCPADSPVVIEEDNSEDILDNYRIKTGYLRLVELTAGALADMYPETNTDYEVYVTVDLPSNISYDAEAAEPYTVFRGYIQAQAFENDWLAYHDEIELPIQSPLGILQDEQIGDDLVSLYEIIEDKFYDHYHFLVLPDITFYDDVLEEQRPLLNMTISREILFPYNKEYNYRIRESSSDPYPPVYDPITKRDFIERLCSAFGLIAHDIGQSLVFTKIGFTGNYMRYDIAGIDPDGGVVIGNGASVINLSSFDFSKDKNKKSFVMPVHKIIREWQEYQDPCELDLSMCHYVADDSYYDAFILQYDGYQIQSTVWSNSGNWNTIHDHIRIASLREDENESLWVKADPTYTTWKIFSVEFAGLSKYINNLHIEVKDEQTFDIDISVYSNGKFYNFSTDPEDPYYGQDWIPIERKKTIHIVDGKCDIYAATLGRSCTINFYAPETYQGINTNIQKINVSSRRNISSKYTDNKTKIHKSVITYNNSSTREKTVNTDFTHYNDGSSSSPEYRELSISQRNMKLILKRNYGITDFQLMTSKFALSAGDQNNRVISTKYDVREDDITLQVMGNQYF